MEDYSSDDSYKQQELEFALYSQIHYGLEPCGQYSNIQAATNVKKSSTSSPEFCHTPSKYVCLGLEELRNESSGEKKSEKTTVVDSDVESVQALPVPSPTVDKEVNGHGSGTDDFLAFCIDRESSNTLNTSKGKLVCDNILDKQIQVTKKIPSTNPEQKLSDAERVKTIRNRPLEVEKERLKSCGSKAILSSSAKWAENLEEKKLIEAESTKELKKRHLQEENEKQVTDSVKDPGSKDKKETKKLMRESEKEKGRPSSPLFFAVTNKGPESLCEGTKSNSSISENVKPVKRNGLSKQEEFIKIPAFVNLGKKGSPILTKQEAAVKRRPPPVRLRRPARLNVQYRAESDTETEYSDSDLSSIHSTPDKAKKRKVQEGPPQPVDHSKFKERVGEFSLGVLSNATAAGQKVAENSKQADDKAQDVIKSSVTPEAKTLKSLKRKRISDCKIDSYVNKKIIIQKGKDVTVEKKEGAFFAPETSKEKYEKENENAKKVQDSRDCTLSSDSDENCDKREMGSKKEVVSSSEDSEDEDGNDDDAGLPVPNLEFNIKGGVDNLLKDADKWHIEDQDRYNLCYAQSRYFCEKKVTCRNCHEEGHLSRDCPKPLQKRCIKCAEVGHSHQTCPQRECFNCGAPGHRNQDCPEGRQDWRRQCDRCWMRGHHHKLCPDRWRQYHMTVDEKFVECDPEEATANPLVFCYNCGAKGHLGYECGKERMSKFIQPPYPFIAHYDGAKRQKKNDVKKGQKKSKDIIKGQKKDENRRGQNKDEARKGQKKDENRKGKKNKDNKGQEKDESRKGNKKDENRKGQRKDEDRKGQKKDENRKGKKKNKDNKGHEKDEDRLGQKKVENRKEQKRSEDRKRQKRDEDRKKEERDEDRKVQKKDEDGKGQKRDGDRKRQKKDEDRQEERDEDRKVHKKDEKRKGQKKDEDREGGKDEARKIHEKGGNVEEEKDEDGKVQMKDEKRKGKKNGDYKRGKSDENSTGQNRYEDMEGEKNDEDKKVKETDEDLKEERDEDRKVHKKDEKRKGKKNGEDKKVKKDENGRGQKKDEDREEKKDHDREGEMKDENKKGQKKDENKKGQKKDENKKGKKTGEMREMKGRKKRSREEESFNEIEPVAKKRKRKKSKKHNRSDDGFNDPSHEHHNEKPVKVKDKISSVEKSHNQSNNKDDRKLSCENISPHCEEEKEYGSTPKTKSKYKHTHQHRPQDEEDSNSKHHHDHHHHLHQSKDKDDAKTKSKHKHIHRHRPQDEEDSNSKHHHHHHHQSNDKDDRKLSCKNTSPHCEEENEYGSTPKNKSKHKHTHQHRPQDEEDSNSKHHHHLHHHHHHHIIYHHHAERPGSYHHGKAHHSPDSRYHHFDSHSKHPIILKSDSFSETAERTVQYPGINSHNHHHHLAHHHHDSKSGFQDKYNHSSHSWWEDDSNHHSKQPHISDNQIVLSSDSPCSEKSTKLHGHGKKNSKTKTSHDTPKSKQKYLQENNNHEGKSSFSLMNDEQLFPRGSSLRDEKHIQNSGAGWNDRHFSSQAVHSPRVSFSDSHTHYMMLDPPDVSQENMPGMGSSRPKKPSSKKGENGKDLKLGKKRHKLHRS